MKINLASASFAMLLALPAGAQTPITPALPVAFQAGTPGAIPGVDPVGDLAIHKNVNMNSSEILDLKSANGSISVTGRLLIYLAVGAV